MKILAIDPGVTTGYCLAEIRNVNQSTKILIDLHPSQMVDDVDGVWDKLDEIKPRYIVCEDFEFRQKSRAGLVLFSVQVIGVVRLYEIKAEHQIAVYLQKASQGKGYYTDKMLRDVGLYKRGIPHGTDALRHLCHWLTFGAGSQFTQGHNIKDITRLV